MDLLSEGEQRERETERQKNRVMERARERTRDRKERESDGEIEWREEKRDIETGKRGKTISETCKLPTKTIRILISYLDL